MEITASALAAHIQRAGPLLEPDAVPLMAAALGSAPAIFRHKRIVFTVLPVGTTDPTTFDMQALPYVLGRRIAHGKNPRCSTVRQTARFLRAFCRSLGDTRPDNYKKSWVATASSSLARVPLAGDLGEVVGKTPAKDEPGIEYTWYDLNAVAIGGIVYRITSRDEAHVFQRLANDQWTRVLFRYELHKLVDLCQLLGEASPRPVKLVANVTMALPWARQPIEESA